MTDLYLLLLFMIAGAIIAVEIRDLLSAVIAVGAVGLALSVAFLILKAPNLAITQLVVEIICLVILIRATVTRDRISARGRGAVLIGLAAVIFVVVFTIFALTPLKELPAFGEPAMRVSETYIEKGSHHGRDLSIVNEILLDYRAYDTVGEATVLFTAVIGVLAVMRKVGRKRAEDPENG